jgi:hypothetical protein
MFELTALSPFPHPMAQQTSMGQGLLAVTTRNITVGRTPLDE